jgi:SAM-dependent methyltransferase
MSLAAQAGGTGVAPDSETLSGMYAGVEAYYSARVAKHGATPLGVDWSCQATQNMRFVQLLKLCDFSASLSLNDIGCGYGALCAFLVMRHADSAIDYLGVDLSRAMISRARRRFRSPDRRFVVGRAAPRVADYSVASGIMNVNVGYSRSVWEDFIATMLSDIRRTSRRGFAVNFVTEAAAATDSQTASLYRTDPKPWVRYCERELGCTVEVLDDYGMREFTLLVRCR